MEKVKSAAIMQVDVILMLLWSCFLDFFVFALRFSIKRRICKQRVIRKSVNVFFVYRRFYYFSVAYAFILRLNSFANWF